MASTITITPQRSDGAGFYECAEHRATRWCVTRLTLSLVNKKVYRTTSLIARCPTRRAAEEVAASHRPSALRIFQIGKSCPPRIPLSKLFARGGRDRV